MARTARIELADYSKAASRFVQDRPRCFFYARAMLAIRSQAAASTDMA